MNQKRSLIEVDSDYREFDVLTEHQSKRQKLLEHDAKEATIKKIETIIRREFSKDLLSKEAEINLIDERINEGRRLLDRLRACIVAQYYSKVIPNGITPLSKHPVIKKFLGKTTKSMRHPPQVSAADTLPEAKDHLLSSITKSNQHLNKRNSQGTNNDGKNSETSEMCRGDRFRIVKKVIVGNVSKYLASDKKEDNDKSTHKWMVYVRSPKGLPPIEEFVEKVVFFLHNSYWPNDVVEITQPPFHLTRRGWGEFPLRVQLHCRGVSKRIFNISHQLKLDRTYTGLQTIGGETVVEIKLDKETDSCTTGRLKDILQGSCDYPLSLEEIQVKEEKVDDDYGDSVESSSKEDSSESHSRVDQQDTNCARLKTDLTSSYERQSIRSSNQQKFGRSPNKNSCSTVSTVSLANSSSMYSCFSGHSSVTDLSNAGHNHSSRLSVQTETGTGENLDLGGNHCMPTRDDSGIFSSNGGSQELPITSMATLEQEKYDVVVCGGNQPLSSKQEDPTDDITIKIEPIENEGELMNGEFKDARNDELETRPMMDMELVSCADVEEEVVLGDTICVEPTPGVDVYAGEGTHEHDTQPLFSLFSQESETARRVFGEIDTAKPVTSASAFSPTSTVCSKIKASTKTGEQDFIRCIDSTGRILKIPRHLVKPSSSSDPKTSLVEVKTMNAKANFSTATVGFASGLSASSQITDTVTKATRGHVISPRHFTSLSLADGSVANVPNQMQTLGANRISNFGGEFPVLKKTKPRSVLNAPGFVVSGLSRKPRNDVVFAVPQKCMPTFSALPSKMILSTRSGNEQKTVTLLSPGVTKESSSLGVRVFSNRNEEVGSQITPVKSRTVASGSRPSVLPNSVPLKTVAMQSVGLQASHQSFVVNKGKSEEVVLKISRPTSHLSLKQMAGGSLVSSPSSVQLLSRPSTSVFPVPTLAVKSSSLSNAFAAGPSVAQCGLVTKSQVSSCARSMLQASPMKPDKSPVILLVPAVSSSGLVQVPSSSVQSSVRPLVLLSKGGVKELSVSPAATPNVCSQRVLSHQNSASGLSSTNHSGEENAATKRVSILRPPGVPMTSLLKKPASAFNSSVGENGEVASADSGIFDPLRKCDETVIKTQIGNQTVIIKLDPIEEAKRRQLDSSSKTPSQALSNLSPQPKCPVVASVSSERHLMFKSIREAQKQLTMEDDIQVKSLDLKDLSAMEDLVRSVVKCHPIYGENADRSVHPYCAPSWNEFLQWNVGKRRAAELCRATAVRRKISLLLNNDTAFHGEAIWSKRQLILWCRHNLYTPFEKELARNLREESKKQLFELNPSEIHSSLTDHKELVDKLVTLSKEVASGSENKNDDVDNLLLDVVSVDNPSERQEKQQRSSIKDLDGMTGVEVIPPSVEAQFVQETTGKIGICFRPTPVLPLDCPNIMSSTSEEMIAAATCAFVNELVRTACADQYENKRNPMELDLSAICRSILRMNRADFLTNRLLGISEDELQRYE